MLALGVVTDVAKMDQMEDQLFLELLEQLDHVPLGLNAIDQMLRSADL
jgi:hypothetical protein